MSIICDRFRYDLFSDKNYFTIFKSYSISRNWISNLSSILFFLNCLREKVDCQARFSGYQGNGLIATTSLPSVPWITNPIWKYYWIAGSELEAAYIVQKVHNSVRKSNHNQLMNLFLQRFHKIILQLCLNFQVALATASLKNTMMNT